MVLPRTIVVSAVNINVGGTLTILRDCLSFLSSIAKCQNLRVISIVYDKRLAYYDNIKYIEIRWAKKMWVNRLWCEYVFMKRLSMKLAPISLWISLHDTTPSVIAKRRVVYCHNSFPFYRWRIKDLFLDYKVVLFALFSKYIYQFNIHKNSYIIVQQNWLKKEFTQMFQLNPEKIIVAYPVGKTRSIIQNNSQINKEKNSAKKYVFFFPSSPGIHKNYELLCQAARKIERKGESHFEVILTIDGTKNKYDKLIVRKYGNIKSLRFVGFLTMQAIAEYYAKVDCLVFPSKMESWGLPISEFSVTEKPMLLADLPYAHTAAVNSKKTAFFNPYKVEELQEKMEQLIKGNESFLLPISEEKVDGYHTTAWNELFDILLMN